MPLSRLPFFARFGIVFVLLQVVLVFLCGDVVQPFMVEHATVNPGVKLLGVLFPNEHPRAVGDTIRSTAISIKVLRGCEGTELYLLLGAAIIAVSTSWRRKLAALFAGAFFVFALNQSRLVLLYIVGRDFREFFQVVHVYVAPLILIAALAVAFSLWVSRALPSPERA